MLQNSNWALMRTWIKAEDRNNRQIRYLSSILNETQKSVEEQFPTGSNKSTDEHRFTRYKPRSFQHQWMSWVSPTWRTLTASYFWVFPVNLRPGWQQITGGVHPSVYSFGAPLSQKNESSVKKEIMVINMAIIPSTVIY